MSKLLAEGRRLREGCKIRWEKRTGDFHFLYTYDQPPPTPDPDVLDEQRRAMFAKWNAPGEAGAGEGGGAE